MKLRHVVVVPLAIALAVGGVLVSAAPASAADQVVTTGADSGPGSLRQAVVDVGPGETVTFAPGVTQVLLESPITLTETVSILGPGSETLTIARGALAPFPLFDTDVVAVGSELVLEGMTLDGRTYPGALPSGVNAPLVSVADPDVGGLTVRDVAFRENTAVSAGGLFAAAVEGAVVIEDSTFTALRSEGTGGALVVEAADGLTVRGSTFGGAGGEVSSQDLGGAIYAESIDDVAILDSSFSGAFTEGSTGDGGAVFGAFLDTVEIVGSTFESNEVRGQGGGGAVSLELVRVSVDVVDSSFIDNAVPAPDGGGAVLVTSSTASVNLTRTTFEGNTAGDGGAVALDDSPGPVTIDGSAFRTNTAVGGRGGAVVIIDPGIGLEIADSLFTANVAGDEGGAISAFDLESFEAVSSEFSDNQGLVGAVFVGASATFTVRGSQFVDNRSPFAASSLLVAEAPASTNIEGSTFAQGTGSALPLLRVFDVPAGGSLTLTDSTFERGPGGSAIDVDDLSGELAVRHSTIVSDVGIAVTVSQSSDAEVSHVAFETSGAPIEIANTPDPADRIRVSWSATSSALDSTAAVDVAGNLTIPTGLELAPLAANGGPTLPSGARMSTRLPEAGSPLIDAGEDPAPTTAGADDQRGPGYPRVVGAAIDIGATEWDAVPTIPETGPQLAATGSGSTGGLLGVAAVLLVAGLGIVVSRRLA